MPKIRDNRYYLVFIVAHKAFIHRHCSNLRDMQPWGIFYKLCIEHLFVYRPSTSKHTPIFSPSFLPNFLPNLSNHLSNSPISIIASSSPNPHSAPCLTNRKFPYSTTYFPHYSLPAPIKPNNHSNLLHLIALISPNSSTLIVSHFHNCEYCLIILMIPSDNPLNPSKITLTPTVLSCIIRLEIESN